MGQSPRERVRMCAVLRESMGKANKHKQTPESPRKIGCTGLLYKGKNDKFVYEASHSVFDSSDHRPKGKEHRQTSTASRESSFKIR